MSQITCPSCKLFYNKNERKPVAICSNHHIICEQDWEKQLYCNICHESTTAPVIVPELMAQLQSFGAEFSKHSKQSPVISLYNVELNVPLGHGKTTAVFLHSEENVGKFAVKRNHIAHEPNELMNQWLKMDILVMRSLSHLPHVVKCYGGGEKYSSQALNTTCSAYAIMEYIPDGTLNYAIMTGKIASWTEYERYHVALCLAQTLVEAHNAGIIHKDFNSSSVLLDGRVPKITGFGTHLRPYIGGTAGYEPIEVVTKKTPNRSIKYLCLCVCTI